MKTIILTLLVSLTLSSCITIKTDGNGSYGNYQNSDYNSAENYSSKPMESREFFVSHFSEIRANSGMKFFIKKSDKQKVVVNSNALGLIVVSSENGILKVKYDNNSSLQNVKTEVTVYTNDFKKLDASSAGRIFISDDFKLDKLALNLHSAGQILGNIFAEKLNIVSTSASGIDANVQAKNIDVEATSASKVKLSGTTNKVNVEATSTAKVYLENLKYQNLNQEVTSLAKVYTK